jgi:homoserine O-acetyltransferase
MTRILIALAAALSMAAHAYDGPVDKKTFALPAYTTVGGKALKDVKVGYEDVRQSSTRPATNAIFVPHFFSGTSHAAGKYAPSDAAPGYWDPIIGAGRPIDTDKYFVISADALANLNVKDPKVVTTGPSTIDPDTGKPYGMTFPSCSYRDTVRVHKALLDSLGVKRLHAVAVRPAVPSRRWSGRPCIPTSSPAWCTSSARASTSNPT